MSVVSAQHGECANGGDFGRASERHPATRARRASGLVRQGNGHGSFISNFSSGTVESSKQSGKKLSIDTICFVQLRFLLQPMLPSSRTVAIDQQHQGRPGPVAL
jgi:hypothetical protein